MRQPVQGERECARGSKCECMFIDPKCPFICVEFLTMQELSDRPDDNQLCVICSRCAFACVSLVGVAVHDPHQPQKGDPVPILRHDIQWQGQQLGHPAIRQHVRQRGIRAVLPPRVQQSTAHAVHAQAHHVAPEESICRASELERTPVPAPDQGVTTRSCCQRRRRGLYQWDCIYWKSIIIIWLGRQREARREQQFLLVVRAPCW